METYLNTKTMIDVNQIIESWTTQEKEINVNWSLLAYPILADDVMALIFERKCVNEDDSFVCDYRILYYDIHKKIYREKAIEFSLQNEMVYTVFGNEDAFRYVGYSMEMDEYYVDSITKGDGMRFYIGNGVCRIAAKPTGEIVVGYDYDETICSDDVFIKIYSHDGVERSNVQNSMAIRCMDLTLDHEFNVWYHLFPYNKIFKIGEDQVEAFEVELSGFDGFALSKDGNTLLVGFQLEDEYTRFYKMELRDHKFCNPTECFIHMSMDINDTYGECLCSEFSCLKSYVALNFGGIIVVSEI